MDHVTYLDCLYLDATQYKHILAHKVFPTLNRHYGVDNWVWTQDGAPSHTSDTVQNYITSKLGSKGFLPKTMWPPSSPNLNPLDFFVWTHVEERACSSHYPNIEALKAAVNREWSSMSMEDVTNACKAFRGRVEACIEAKGFLFEK